MSHNPTTDNLLRFLDASPSPWHAGAEVSRRLKDAGVPLVAEDMNWSPQPGKAFHTTRGGSTVAAVRVPAGFAPKDPPPFHIVAAHTDSPCPRLKPRPPRLQHGYRQWGVELYGGALFNSWLDRDLGIAGRVFSPGAPEPKHVRLDAHPVRIPQLAIHLDKTVNEKGVVLNAQKHLVPILGQDGGDSLEAALEGIANAPFSDLTFELCLFDTQPAAYGGFGDAFVYSGRLDNLAMCHAALSAFVDAPAETSIQVVALFDHEEAGSTSSRGAQSNFLAGLLERVALGLGVDRAGWLRMLPQSLLVSADMAHAIHPNYPEMHDADHAPRLNGGPVLKANANLRYASDAFSGARFMEWARRAGVPVQNFVNRSDLGCGTTVGPLLAAQLGIPAVDAGSAMLSMHSAREMAGADDPAMMTALLREFLRG